MLELQNVSKSFGSRKLFANVNLRIGPRERLGLVGPNGTGKTTIFRIMLGEMSPDTGRVEVQKGLRIGYLCQETSPLAAAQDSILQWCTRQARGVGVLQDERQACLARLEQGDADEALVHRMAEIDDELQARGADGLPGEAERVLRGLGFPPEDMCKPLRALSGGLLMRVELARLLLDRPDLLLLDEPTNHLDLEGLLWFEEYLSSFQGAVVIVAHDREFLNRTVSRIVEVSTRGAVDFGGNPNVPVYDRYLEERAKALALAWKHYEEQQAEIRDIEDFIARNRVRKDRANVVQSRIRGLEKLERLVPPEPIQRVRFKFPSPERTPDLVLSLDGVAKRYGEKTVFSHLDLRLHRGEKVALVGINGAGKSTLLRVVAGVAPFDGGERKLADRADVGYFSQDQLEILKPGRTALEHLYEVADARTAPHVKGILGAFLFSDDDMGKKASAMSGGEKARLMLARLLLQPHGLLVLDEPTNHLDIGSREVLEDALRQHAGTILFTSHDRRFMDVVAGATVEVKDGRLTRYEGNYSYYASKQMAVTAAQNATVPAVRAAPTNRELEKAQKRAEAERRNTLFRLLRPLKEQLASVEAEIAAAEAELARLDAEMASPTLYEDGVRAREVTLKARETRNRLNDLMALWEGTAEQLETATREAEEAGLVTS